MVFGNILLWVLHISMFLKAEVMDSLKRTSKHVVLRQPLRKPELEVLPSLPLRQIHVNSWGFSFLEDSIAGLISGPSGLWRRGEIFA